MEVLIYNETGERIESRCSGPRWSGVCPGVEGGGPVPCAGRRIVARLNDGREIALDVQPDASTCPLAAFNLVGTGSAA